MVAVLGLSLLIVAVADRSLAGARTSTQLTTTQLTPTDDSRTIEEALPTTVTVTSTAPTTTAAAPVEDQRRVVVEPADGLRDGQPLQVEIRRPPSQILVDICVTDDGDNRGCAFFPRTTRTSASYTERAARFIVTRAGRIVDCAERKGRCVLRVYNVADVALEYDPSVPSPAFGYNADPTTSLRGRDSVHLSGTTPAKSMVVSQCVATPAPKPICVPVTGIAPTNSGSFSGDVAVSRALVGPDRDYDCAKEACELRLLPELMDGPALARFDLSFSATEPFAPSSVRLESSTIHDGDSVTVRGSELVAGAFVSVQVCGTPSNICETRMYNATIDPGGSFSVAVALRERTTGFAMGTGNVEIDCATHPCRLVVNVNRVRSYGFDFQFGDDGVAQFDGERRNVRESLNLSPIS